MEISRSPPILFSLDQFQESQSTSSGAHCGRWGFQINITWRCIIFYISFLWWEPSLTFPHLHIHAADNRQHLGLPAQPHRRSKGQGISRIPLVWGPRPRTLIGSVINGAEHEERTLVRGSGKDEWSCQKVAWKAARDACCRIGGTECLKVGYRGACEFWN